MTRRSALVLPWTLGVLGGAVGVLLVVLGTSGGRAEAGAVLVTAPGLLVLAGAGWQLTRLGRHSRAVHPDDAPGREVRAWHLAVAWLVAAVIAAIGVLLLAGGLVGLVGRSNVVAGTLLAVAGLLVLWGDLSYGRGILRSRCDAVGLTAGSAGSAGSADDAHRPHDA